MPTHKENFNLWFRDIIEALYENKHAGFAILMLVFPLMERYLRSKSKTFEKNLNPRFFKALGNLFPVLSINNNAKTFWEVYRHGILHQATLSQKQKDGWLNGKPSCDKNGVDIYADGAFWVNPVEFAKHIIEIIDQDFSNFEAPCHTRHTLSIPQTAPDGSHGTSGV